MNHSLDSALSTLKDPFVDDASLLHVLEDVRAEIVKAGKTCFCLSRSVSLYIPWARLFAEKH